MNETGYCEACRFFEADEPVPDPIEVGEAVVAGECRRHAPQARVHLHAMAPSPTAVVGMLWPVVVPGDWCGEWAAPSRG